MTTQLDLTYPNILRQFGSHVTKGRLESRAFLGWFLEHYYRLDEIDAQDTVCDGPDDKGIDGIYVNQNLERIDVFQTKLYQNRDRTIGDAVLKEFIGTLGQLRDTRSIEQLMKETKNSELRGLLEEKNISALLESGFEIRGVFITNAVKDANTDSYLRLQKDLSVFDRAHLLANWIAPGDSSPVSNTASFRLDGLGSINYKTAEAEVFIAPLLANELIQLGGLENQELFAWNVRQSLGKTKVNKAISDSVKNVDEHKNFLFYHNGLTILAESATLEGDELTIDGYTVVNGCQSLSTLYDHRDQVSDELRLLTRVIKLPPHEELAAKITRHSNNQNAISARDLQSNSTIQRRLQTEFRTAFGTALGYEIKRGEQSDAARTITNEQAARLLLAFDLRQPWSCHQSYRLFDELHSEVFGRPEVSAYRIAFLDLLQTSINRGLDKLKDQLVARYNLTQYLVLYLVRLALEKDELGARLLKNPRQIWEEFGPEAISSAFDVVVDDLVVDLNAELAERNDSDSPFDHKRELKSPNAIRDLSNAVLPSYEKAIRRNRATSFSSELRVVVRHR